MKIVSILLTALLCWQVNATESVKAFLESESFDQFCEKVIKEREPFEALGTTWKHIYLLRNPVFSENSKYLYMGIANPKKDLGNYTIFRVEKSDPSSMKEFLQLKESGLDIFASDDYLWVLYKKSLVRVNLSNLAQDEILFPQNENAHKYDHAYDMVAVNGKVYITNGTAGLIVINQNTMAIERTVDLGLFQSNGHKSLAASIVGISDKAVIVGVDNLTLPVPGSNPFNGLVEVNLYSFSNKKYPYKSGIISRQSKLVFDGKTLWINNTGTLQYIDLASLRKNGTAYTGWINRTYFEGDKKYAVEPRGEFFVNGKDIFTCSVRSRLMISKRESKIGLAYRFRDGAVSKQYKLNKLKLDVDFKWVSGPFVSDYSKSAIQVELFNQQGNKTSLSNGMQLGIYAFMPSMGHAAFDLGYFELTDIGTYTNSNLMLGMGGDWVIELKVYDKNDQEIDSVKLEEFL